MRLMDLKIRHKEIIQKIKTLNKAQEKRSLTSAENTELETLFTEGTALKKDIEQRERVKSLELSEQASLIPAKEKRTYNFGKAVKALAGHRLNGYEAEVHQELENRGAKTQNAQGILIPAEDFFAKPQMEKRVVNAQSALISDPIKPSEFLPALYEQTIMDRLGPKRISAQGKFTFPKAGTVASSWWNADGTGSLTESDPSFTSVGVEPKYLGVISGWSLKQIMEMTADLSLESLVRESLAMSMAEKLDESFCTSDGSSGSPMGIISSIPPGNETSKAYSATIAWTLAELLKEKKSLKEAYKNNAIMPKWLINPQIESEWEGTQRFSDGPVALAMDGMACGIPYFVSNHLSQPSPTPEKFTEIILGDFSQFMITTFQAVEISLGMIDDDFKKGLQRLRAILAIDMTILRSEAFRKITVDRKA